MAVTVVAAIIESDYLTFPPFVYFHNLSSKAQYEPAMTVTVAYSGVGQGPIRRDVGTMLAWPRHALVRLAARLAETSRNTTAMFVKIRPAAADTWPAT